MKKTYLVCVDRDGTINEDENYFLGSSEDWEKKIKFLKGVISGLKFLNQIPNLKIFITTNQSGVALCGSEGNKIFDLLTEQRMHKVNECMIEKLKQQGVKVDGYFACPYIDSAYVEKAKKRGRKVNNKYIQDGHPDLKPGFGMIEKAARKIGKRLEDCVVYVIGDRKSDVEVGINSHGTGILVPSYKTRELGDIERVQKLMNENPERVYIAKDFLDAAKYVGRRVV